MRSERFLEGLTTGMFGSAVGASALLYILRRSDVVSFSGFSGFSDDRLSVIRPWLDWAYTNLGLSIPVFAVVLIAYFFSLGRLRSYLDSGRAINEIVHLDHLTDIWTTLFFGTGVIWTAIGMRSALIFALGNSDTAIQLGAFAMLERMVDGGILLALSTTIFGGIGGYLMRIYKTVTLGTLLQRKYDQAARVDTSIMRESLQRIEQHLAKPETASEAPDATKSDS
jgi:hypothetical protein